MEAIWVYLSIEHLLHVGLVVVVHDAYRRGGMVELEIIIIIITIIIKILIIITINIIIIIIISIIISMVIIKITSYLLTYLPTCGKIVQWQDL